MACFFSAGIHDWTSWGQVYQSIDDFEPLAEQIFTREDIPFQALGHLKPGTNAVFSSGCYVVKIYAPEESGMDTLSDYQTELFGLSRAEKLLIPVPKLVASGCVQDKYLFRYLIMEKAEGIELGVVEKTLSAGEKREIGIKLRSMIDILSTPCLPFNKIDVLRRAYDNRRWQAYPGGFQAERDAYLNTLTIPENEKVFVHGDLNPDNVMIKKDGAEIKLCIIDFADALSAPLAYEYATVASVLFCFEEPYMSGFFGSYRAEDIADLCIKGLLLHEYGADSIGSLIGPAVEITSVDILRDRLLQRIKNESQKVSI
jgi:serine/threonine protein kinase